jgi:1,4-alpha-glucan branching enzyme
VPRTGYVVPLPRDGTWRERVNTDSREYGGSGMGNFGAVVAEHGSARITLPPLATLILSHGG